MYHTVSVSFSPEASRILLGVLSFTITVQVVVLYCIYVNCLGHHTVNVSFSPEAS